MRRRALLCTGFAATALPGAWAQSVAPQRRVGLPAGDEGRTLLTAALADRVSSMGATS
jgi:hypothetical protein